MVRKEEQLTFWDSTGKIQPSQLSKFFEEKGIGLYHPDSTKTKGATPKVVQVVEGLVNEVSEAYLISMAREHILKYSLNGGNSEPILDSLHKNTSLFSGRNLQILPVLDICFLEDTRDCTYFFYLNGVVEVKKNGCEFRSYTEIDGCVWENNIIKREVNLQDKTVINKSVFFQFIRDITSVKDKKHSNTRIISMCTAIGYLLNRYKNPGLTKGVILMDENVSDGENGGTGKTLVAKAINELRNLHNVDGKFYDPKQWFQFDRVSLSTEVVLFDDVNSKFDFSRLFSIMSTGFEVKQRYKDSIYIPFEKSPKVMITTNYAINGEGSSFKRRAFEFEVSHYYSDTLKPDDKFGHLFFEDWDDTEWNMFYKFMFWCSSLFHRKGLFESEPINIKKSKLVNQTSEDFLEFAADNLKLNEKEDKAGLYAKFLLKYPEYKTLQRKKFTDWLKKWGNYNDFKINEPHSNTTRYIEFVQKPKETALNKN